MSSELLLQQVQRVADQDGAVRLLRQFVLGLAVRGRLAPQEDTGNSTVYVVDRSTRDTRSTASPSRRAAGSRLPIQPLPFEVPESWAWASLLDVCQVSYGFAFDSARFCQPGRGRPLIRIRDIASLDTQAYYDGPYDPRYVVSPGDYLVGMDGDFNLRQWNGPEALLNQRVLRLHSWREDISPRWAEIPLQMILDHLHSSTSQTTVKHLSAKQVNGILIPLPPLEEQKRIVGKVEELLALCERLRATQAEREAHRDRLRVTSLRNLVAPEEPKETARFFLRHSARMITKAPHVAGVRQAILDLAVRGRLVAQDAEDEPISDLLRGCDAARAEVARTDRRADIAQQEMLATELRWGIPDTWVWRGLADLVLFIDYRGKTPTKVASGVRLITAKNVRPGYVSFEPQEFITEIEYKGWMTRGLPADGDVLFTTEAPMGNAAVVRFTEPFALAQRIINFRPLGATTPQFLAFQIESAPFQRMLASTATGLTALGIKGAKLKRLPIAVPPLAEQQRIVAKVDELMAVCDELERTLSSEETERTRLLEALLYDALVLAEAPVYV